VRPDDLLELEPFSLGGAEKDQVLGAALHELTAHHRAGSPAYARVLSALWADPPAGRTPAEVPWIPVGLFKTHVLRSVPEGEIVKVLHSTGTSGAASSVHLDRDSTRRQTRALAATMRAVLGRERRAMLIVDAREGVADRARPNARAAGILGMSTFGRDHLYLLDAEHRVRHDELAAWLARHRDDPLLVFGFTHMVWRHLAGALERGEADLSRAVLMHVGGWKALAEEAVSREHFAAVLREQTGVPRICDYYGMVEQIGSVFLEGECGHLHAPNHADVIVRDPVTWAPLPDGREGVIEVLSALPTSYPGHAILTEDRGTVLCRDGCSCGWRGAALRVHGRLPAAELRGCSDVRALEGRLAA
jgi:phenylacetate-coenzyme A ligase PaaK-like adenylate-forming protein